MALDELQRETGNRCEDSMPKSSSTIAAQSSLYKTGEFTRTFPVAIETSSLYVSFHIGTSAHSDCREAGCQKRWSHANRYRRVYRDTFPTSSGASENCVKVSELSKRVVNRIREATFGSGDLNGHQVGVVTSISMRAQTRHAVVTTNDCSAWGCQGRGWRRFRESQPW